MTTHDSTPIIAARRLRKRFGSGAKAVDALAGLDLVAPSGQVTAVLGPNGAGKTTFVRSVATLCALDDGDLHVAGIDVRSNPEAVRRVIGLAGQYAAVEGALSGRENLVMVAKLFGHRGAAARRAADAVLERIGLSADADRLARGYSGGMRRRLDLGASLVGAPRLLILDEPTTGLDPRSRVELWDAIRVLVAGGTDVLLTTQYLEEADQLADHVVIIDHGQAIATGTPSDLKSAAGRDRVEIRVADAADLGVAGALLARLGPEAPQLDVPNRRVTVGVDRGAERLAEALQLLAADAIAVDDVGVRRPTLDEVFITLTGRGADEETTAADHQADHQTDRQHTAA